MRNKTLVLIGGLVIVMMSLIVFFVALASIAGAWGLTRDALKEGKTA